MIIQNIYLEDWDWHIVVYYSVDDLYVDEILAEMTHIGCNKIELKNAEDLLKEGFYNVGLTFSDFKNRCSIVVIGLTNSPEEFQNTFDHEKGHLAMHIGEALDIDIFGEEYQYLTGEIGQKMFKVAKRFMCEHCRDNLNIKISQE